MSNNGPEFTPEQVEQQIDMLMQSQKPWSDPSSDVHLISELYQVYTDDNATVERIWQHLTEYLASSNLRSVAEDVTLQRHSHMSGLPEQERPQKMNIIHTKGTGKRLPHKMLRLLELCAALLMVAALVAGMTILVNATRQKQTRGSSYQSANTATTAAPNATIISASTIVFSDPLSMNIHDWPVASSGPSQYSFKDNAYHIRNAGINAVAAICPHKFSETALSYQITLEEVAGDDTSSNNTFGMIFNYNTKKVKGKEVMSFYVFEILNQGTSSQYSFYKYDNSTASPWSLVGRSIRAGKEFHAGHGAHAMNVIKIVGRAGVFLLYVNGQQVGTARDSSLMPGSVGMMVNETGAEVAFSNMLITRP